MFGLSLNGQRGLRPCPHRMHHGVDSKQQDVTQVIIFDVADEGDEVAILLGQYLAAFPMRDGPGQPLPPVGHFFDRGKIERRFHHIH